MLAEVPLGTPVRCWKAEVSTEGSWLQRRRLWQSHGGSQVEIVPLWVSTPAAGEVSVPVQWRRKHMKGVLTAHCIILCKHLCTPGKSPSVFKVQRRFYLLRPSELILPSLHNFYSLCVLFTVKKNWCVYRSVSPHPSPVDVGECGSIFQNLEQCLAHTLPIQWMYNVLNKMRLTNEGDNYKAIKGVGWHLGATVRIKRRSEAAKLWSQGPPSPLTSLGNQAGGPAREVQESQVRAEQGSELGMSKVGQELSKDCHL